MRGPQSVKKSIWYLGGSKKKKRVVRKKQQKKDNLLKDFHWDLWHL